MDHSVSRSDYGRNIWDSASDEVRWPSERSVTVELPLAPPVFATWALTLPGLRLQDVSRLLGHTATRVATGSVRGRLSRARPS